MQRRGLTKEQKRVIHENPHLQIGKIAKFLGLKIHVVRYQREKNKSYWSYEGIGIPFCFFDICGNPHWSILKSRFRFAKTSNLKKAISIVDHLIWCIENNMFNQPRIEHPYLENLKFGE